MSPLSAQEVEKELSDLWKPGPQDKTKDLGLQRIYTTNLVAYVPSADDGERVERILNDLVESHPGRYILIKPAAEAGLPLKHSVSGHCVLSNGRAKSICCDLIKLEAGEEAIENLYGFTFSLLVPDLPVEFWWTGDLPTDHSFFHHMADEAIRAWVDSSRFSRVIPTLAFLSAKWESLHPDTILGDLNWLRIHRWRALIAELFDGEWARFIPEIQRFTVEYGEGTQPTRSFYLACWLASQLGWKYKGPRIFEFKDELRFEGPHGPVEVFLKPVPVHDVKRDRIFSVRIATGGENPGLFTVMRDKDPHCVSVQSKVGPLEGSSRAVTFQHLHSNELLNEGFRHLEPDLVWNKTLQMAGTVLEKSS